MPNLFLKRRENCAWSENPKPIRDFRDRKPWRRRQTIPRCDQALIADLLADRAIHILEQVMQIPFRNPAAFGDQIGGTSSGS